MELEQITTGAALGPLLDQARAEGTCAVDTEFVWERTYAPALCLVQLATAERLAVIDPLAGAPLDPVAELMADPAVEKVMHAPSGDLAAFVLHNDVRPRNVFDTQVAAGFAGYGGSPSLERLLEQAVGVRLRHDEGFTDCRGGRSRPCRSSTRPTMCVISSPPPRRCGRGWPTRAGRRGWTRRCSSATARARRSCRTPSWPGAG